MTTRCAHWRLAVELTQPGRLTTMGAAATSFQQPVDTEAIAARQEHWVATFDANPDM
jgi:hypothetical protein